jgi:hypothetical protein
VLLKHGALTFVLSTTLVAFGARGALGAEAPLVLVAPARDTAGARRAAHDLAEAVRSVVRARAEEIDVTTAPREALASRGARAIVVVDATADAFALTAVGADGRTWAPRPVARGDGEAVDAELVAAAGCSIVAAVLATPDAPSSLAPPPSPPLAASPPPEPRADAPERAAPSPAPTAPPADAGSARAERHARARVDAALIGVNVGSQLLLHTGVTAGAWWQGAPLGVGAQYAFYPGAVVDGLGASFLLTRHTFAIGARAEVRLGRWAVVASAGPLAEVWVRSTRAVDATASATPSSTRVTAGAFARGGLTFWIVPGLGVDAGLGLELAPGSPHYRGPSGADLLDPNVGRIRADVGMSAEFP